jgi:hypothetical protein
MAVPAVPPLFPFYSPILKLVGSYSGLERKFSEYGSRGTLALPSNHQNAQALIGEMLVAGVLGTVWDVEFVDEEGIDLIATLTPKSPNSNCSMPVEVMTILDRSENLFEKTFARQKPSPSSASTTGTPGHIAPVDARQIDMTHDLQVAWDRLDTKLGKDKATKRLLAVVDASGIYDFQDEIVPMLGLVGRSLEERQKAIADAMPQLYSTWERNFGRPLSPAEKYYLSEETLRLNLDLANKLNEESWHSITPSNSHIHGVLWLEIVHHIADDPLACLNRFLWWNPS